MDFREQIRPFHYSKQGINLPRENKTIVFILSDCGCITWSNYSFRVLFRSILIYVVCGELQRLQIGRFYVNMSALATPAPSKFRLNGQCVFDSGTILTDPIGSREYALIDMWKRTYLTILNIFVRLFANL